MLISILPPPACTLGRQQHNSRAPWSVAAAAFAATGLVMRHVAVNEKGNQCVLVGGKAAPATGPGALELCCWRPRCTRVELNGYQHGAPASACAPRKYGRPKGQACSETASDSRHRARRPDAGTPSTCTYVRT